MSLALAALAAFLLVLELARHHAGADLAVLGAVLAVVVVAGWRLLAAFAAGAAGAAGAHAPPPAPPAPGTLLTPSPVARHRLPGDPGSLLVLPPTRLGARRAERTRGAGPGPR